MSAEIPAEKDVTLTDKQKGVVRARLSTLKQVINKQRNGAPLYLGNGIYYDEGNDSQVKVPLHTEEDYGVDEKALEEPWTQLEELKKKCVMLEERYDTAIKSRIQRDDKERKGRLWLDEKLKGFCEELDAPKQKIVPNRHFKLT